MAAPLINPGFEDGNLTGWAATSGVVVSNAPHVFSGTYAAHIPDGTTGVYELVQTTKLPAYASLTFQATAYYEQGSAPANTNVGNIFARWYDDDDNLLGQQNGNLVTSSRTGPDWKGSTVNAAYITGATKVAIGWYVNKNRTQSVHIDQFSWTYPDLPVIDLVYPINNSTYASGDEVPFRVEIPSGMEVASVTYRATNIATTAVTAIGPATESPWGTNYSALPAATYSVVARVTFTNGYVADSDAHTLIIGTPPAPDTREYKASNSYTNLVAKNFVGIASAIPPTARVVGMETVVDYYLQALIRSKDLGVSDPVVARYSAAFEMVPNVSFETVLLEDNNTSYTAVGGSASTTKQVLQSDFSVTEDGTSEGKRWTVLEGDPQQVVIGSSTDLFGLDFMTASEFTTKALGLRFYPNLAAKPDYADSGDACFRVNLDKLRIQIYFDAGSVEYYFVSPDGTQVIKGRLAAAYVDSGAFANGDASGIMQLASDLEIVEGTSRTIQDDWTIHSAYPADEANQIGVVSADMSYNGLPTYGEVTENRSRYQFISANFYGDLTYDSIYGVNGVDRAFSYNGDFFYKIHTQSDAEKDKPRHVEFYHTHLALGYGEGRVDVSVVGEPYNFNGADGASSWAIGDSVVGLQNLSGTMLGIFCRKSIHGLAGTTVDNFATAVLSPKIGAVEYTVTDMGFPVYANAYGIYTLAQTEKYGEYLGTPMSQDVSPWLRKRLVRKSISPREVVVAWPVRAKNQYRLAFKDGYVLTMTMNNGLQEAPTFSQQKYFVDSDSTPVTLYDYVSIVPVAISSELDDGGEERIHIANGSDFNSEELGVPSIYGEAPDDVAGDPYSFTYTTVSGGAPIAKTILLDGSYITIGDTTYTIPSNGWEWDESTATITGNSPVGMTTVYLHMQVEDVNGQTAEHSDSFVIMDAFELLVSGSPVSTGQPMMCKFNNVGSTTPVGIEQSTGATLASAVTGYDGTEWCAVSFAGARYAPTLNSNWTSGTSTGLANPGQVFANSGGWIANTSDGSTIYTETSGNFAVLTRTATNSAHQAALNGAYRTFKLEGYWYSLSDGYIFRCVNPNTDTWDTLRVRPNGEAGRLLCDLVWKNGILYGCGAVTGAPNIYGVCWSPDGGLTWPIENILFQTLEGSSPPVRIYNVNNVLVTYCVGGNLRSETSDWATVSTNMSGVSDGGQPAVRAAVRNRVNPVDSLLYVLGTSVDSNKLVTFNPITLNVSDPVILPITSAVSITARRIE